MIVRQRPPLTSAQQKDAARFRGIAIQAAREFARSSPHGLSEADFLSEAHEALVDALRTYDPEKSPLPNYLWLRVRGALKNLIGHARKDASLRALNDCLAYASDSDDPFEAPEATHLDLRDVMRDAAAALVTGNAGHLWHTRGEETVVMRAEYLRAIKHLHTEVARLPPAHATVVELRYFREMPIEQVAATAGCSPQKVPRLLADALRLLRARLEAHGVAAVPVP